MSIRAGYPNRRDYHGNVTTTQADLDQWVERVWRAGIQPNCHANGDVAIDMYLTSLERAQRLFPRHDVRPKFTHSTLAYPDLIARMKALDAVPALFTSYAYYNRYSYNDSDSVVVGVQQRLARAGYYRGAIDGVIGPRTQYAIRAYERSHGLPADGVIDHRGVDAPAVSNLAKPCVAEKPQRFLCAEPHRKSTVGADPAVFALKERVEVGRGRAGMEDNLLRAV